MEYRFDDIQVELEEDEHSLEDLIGLRVISTAGEELGSVEDVIPSRPRRPQVAT